MNGEMQGASCGFLQENLAVPHRRLASKGDYFVAARREPSGSTIAKPGGLRRSANENAPKGACGQARGRRPRATGLPLAGW